MMHHDTDQQNQTTADRDQNMGTLKEIRAIKYTDNNEDDEDDISEFDIMDILMFNHPK